ncbi:PREDICTED: osteocalcin [Gekko japonicus]|uniref:Osteocalcin n=1 Tax=Gekko japonicus TaxID=146911 RepID=A0ABM1KPZ2_GEKJA|nr:PREDICTED: osteocalcin [Gekko japonicus]
MRTLTLVCLLAAVTLCLCHGDDWAHSNDSPSSEAFISRRDSAAIVKRQPGSPQGAAAVAVPDVASPLESHREICELSVACDELADQIGFEEAYRRFYGPV